MQVTQHITLEAAIEWVEYLAHRLDVYHPTLTVSTQRFAKNQPRGTLSGKLFCAYVRDPHDMNEADYQDLRDGKNCVVVKIEIDWGGHTHYLVEPIQGARISVTLIDHRTAKEQRASFWIGHYDKEESVKQLPIAESLESLTAAVVKAIEAIGPIRPARLHPEEE